MPAKNASWPPEVVRAIIEYVDNNKGVRSIFINDIENASRDTKRALTNVASKENLRKITPEKIRKKLKEIADKGNATSLSQFLARGKEVLDLSQLAAGTYTQEEIGGNASRKVDSTPNNASIKSLPGQRSASRRRVSNGSLAGSSPKRSRIDSNGHRESEIPNTDLDGIREPGQVWGSEEAGPCKVANCGALFRQASELNAHGEAHNTAGLATTDHEPGIQNSTVDPGQVAKGTDAVAADIAGLDTSAVSQTGVGGWSWGELKIIEFMDNDTPCGRLDPEKITETIESLKPQIRNAIESLLRDTKTTMREVATLDLAAYEDDLLNILGLLFGNVKLSSVEKDTTWVNSHDGQLRLHALLLGITGAALTSWAFIPVSQGGTSLLEQETYEFVSSKSKLLALHIQEGSLGDYMNKHISPRVEHFAESMAQTLSYLLRHFLVADTSTQGDKIMTTLNTQFEGIPEVPQAEGQGTVRGTASLHGWPPAQNSTPISKFVESMKESFKIALRLRIRMETGSDSTYKFLFPRFQQRYDPKKHMIVDPWSMNAAPNTQVRAEDNSSDDLFGEESRSYSKILIGFLPCIESTDNTGISRLRPQERSMIVSKGGVCLLKDTAR
ncbi:hypothetical protein LTR66_016192 [Elasticomyces elasticus]|nr:hypothetical protein LTR66_016192 [Elasticomyces elasticus]